MWDRVTIQTKAASAPITTADMKARLSIQTADFDSLIDDFVLGAVARVDGPSGIGVAMMQQTWRKTFDGFPAMFNPHGRPINSAMFNLPGWPIKSVTSIKYRDASGVEQTVAAGDYRVDMASEPVRVALKAGKSWPATDTEIASVWVDYVVGEVSADDISKDLIDAVALLVAHRFEHREAVAESTMAEVPLGFQHITQEHNRLRVAA